MKQRRIDPTLTIAALALTTLLILTALPRAGTAAPRLQVNLNTFSCDDVTEIPQAECEALVALYNSTDGANWSNNSGWLDTNTPCNWYGVTCSAGHVTELSLDWNQLSGSIPPEVGNLTNLQYLYLRSNQLSGSIPPQLGNLTNLQELWLCENQLSGIIPPQLGNLANLQQLCLGVNQLGGSIPPELGSLTDLAWLMLFINQLSGSIPAELGDLVSLETLDLSGNQLSGSIPPQLDNLANLQLLCLSSNQLSGSIPVELGNLTNLGSLVLSGNQLSGSIPAELGNLANLQHLVLSSNQLSSSIPVELSNLTDLRTLDLHGNQLIGSIPLELGNLANLQGLNLISNQLSGSIPPELGNLTNLQYLSLGGNQLSGSIPVELGDLTNLQQLYLYSNQLSGSIPPELGNLTNLEYLYLHSNQFSGALPGTLTNLTKLYLFWFHNTNLCEPADVAFQAWLAGITYLMSTGVICPSTDKPPVVLVHGHTGNCDTTSFDSSFQGMPYWLNLLDGYPVYCAHLETSWERTPRIRDNVPNLMEAIDQAKEETDSDKVILIAHSMGGIVARAYLESSEYRGDVSRVYMLGSPNKGLASQFIANLLAVLFNQPALVDLNPSSMENFNRRYPQRAHNVFYRLIGGDAPTKPIFGLIIPGKDDGIIQTLSVHHLDGSLVTKYTSEEYHSKGWGHPSYFIPREPEDIFSQSYRECIRPELLGTGTCPQTMLSVSEMAAEAEPILNSPIASFTGVITTGYTISHTVFVDTSGAGSFNLFWVTGTLAFSLTTPTGTVIDPAYAQTSPQVEYGEAPITDSITAAATYYITNTIPGTWTLTVSGVDTGAEGVLYAANVVVESDVLLSTDSDRDLYTIGDTAVVTASLTAGGSGVSGATVQATIHRADGIAEIIPLYDDGAHNDGAVRDGLYGGSYTVAVSGYHVFRASAEGTVDDEPFRREAQGIFIVASQAASLSGSYADYPVDEDDDGRYEWLALDVGVDANRAGDYTLSAQLVGDDGTLVSHVLTYTTFITGTQAITVFFDGEDILRSGLDGPYTVTEVYLMDDLGASIPADIEMDVWTTAAYDYRQFGTLEKIYLPLILKNR